MRRLLLALVILAFAAEARAATALPKKKPEPCAIDGAPMHWISDYCVATLQTDDEIPANYCIREEQEIKYPDECSAKRFYKRRLCELAVEQRTRKGNVDDCMADRSFMGRAVARGGSQRPK